MPQKEMQNAELMYPLCGGITFILIGNTFILHFAFIILHSQTKTSRPQQDGMFMFDDVYASIFMMFATRMPQGVPMT